ncbi:hypothetical protein HDU67_001905 [Dinochytrium kinnereticum]|nr:hypothetical protein HDU67_001905 [Dinochytrium kinnereticum]
MLGRVLRIRPTAVQPLLARRLAFKHTVALGSVIDAEDKTFDDVLSSAGSTTVIVDFHASWCPPCKMLAPVLSKAVKENGKTFLVKVNVDEAQATAEKYQIASLPTVAAFRDSKVVDQFIGFHGEKETRAFVDRNAQ